MGLGLTKPLFALSLAGNLAFAALLGWMLVMPPTGGSDAASPLDAPTRGGIRLFGVEYILRPEVASAARDSFDEGFYSSSDLSSRPFIPKYKTNDVIPAHGSCLIVQTRIELPDTDWVSEYEEASCTSQSGLIVVEAEDLFDTRIGVLFASGDWAKVSGETYVFTLTSGNSESISNFRGTMPLMYTVPRTSDGLVYHDDLRYESVPFSGEIRLTFHGLVEWKRGTAD